jgi:hypothetical protein
MDNAFKKVAKSIDLSNYVLIGGTLLYVAAGWGLSYHFGQLDHFSPLYYSGTVGFVTATLLFVFVVGWLLKIMILDRPVKLVHEIKEQGRSFVLTEGRLVKAIPVFICFIIFISTFTSLKTILPAIQPFSWDETFMQWDRLLHFGYDPWRLLQPLFGYGVVTFVLNFIYNLWFFIMFAVLYWQLFSVSNPVRRMRFFFTFFLTWMINGSFLAIIFSSAGPCFYQQVTGDSYYMPLMDYLNFVDETYHLFALVAQDVLWTKYSEFGLGLGSGISAMPSLHVAVAVLFAFVGWDVSRRWGIIFTAYALCILVGSVHLGWHYAIDGYVSGFVTAALWLLMGRFFKKDEDKL